VLSVEATGLPELRRYLLPLAADQNLKDHRYHIREFFPGLVAKICRVVDPNRTEGFKGIAEVFNTCIKSAAVEFEQVLTRCLNDLSAQTLSLLLEDRDHYVRSLDQEAEIWAKIRFPTFRKFGTMCELRQPS
jgi:hypothetical protein